MDNLNVATCIALGAVLPAVDWVIVSMRLYVKHRRRRQHHNRAFHGFHLDDLFIVLALVSLPMTLVKLQECFPLNNARYSPQPLASHSLLVSRFEVSFRLDLTNICRHADGWLWPFSTFR